MFILTDENSIANDILIEIRDKHIQKDRMKFRSNVEKLGSFLAYEISKSLKFKEYSVSTSLGSKETVKIEHYPNLICVLRAGMPFFQGFLNVFEKSDCGFVGSFRKESLSMDKIEIESNYFSSPDLNGKDLIIIDPMLATGKSFINVVNKVKSISTPRSIHIACLVASEDGINFINKNLDCKIWTVDLDNELDSHSYIVPGLGDAGDLSYGHKV